MLNDEYIYRIDNPPAKLDNWNDYFVRYLTENDQEYLQCFLHYYESTLNKKAYAFIKQYNLEEDRLDDFKQIFVMVLIEELTKYDANDKIALLQKIKYPLWNKWNEYVRENCGTVTIGKAGTYSNTRKIARLYFELENTMPYDDIVSEIANQTKLTEKTVRELINAAILFKNHDDVENAIVQEDSIEKVESAKEQREQSKKQ